MLFGRRLQCPRRVRLCGKRTEISQQCEDAVAISSVVVASGSAGTHAGLAVGLEQLMPQAELIGVTVSRSVADQLPKVEALQQAVANSLELQAKAILWMTTLPGYGTPNEDGMAAVKLLAQLEGILLDPVYTGKAMAGLIDGITQKRFKDEGPILFVPPAERRRCLPIILTSNTETTACKKVSNWSLIPPFSAERAVFAAAEHWRDVFGRCWALSGADAHVASLAGKMAGAHVYLHFPRHAAYRPAVYDLLRLAAVRH